MQEFLKENRKLNLSAFRTDEHSWVGNILDSLAILNGSGDLFIGAKKMLDLGTGGGFPLLPLAVSLPDLSCTGMDATQKKIDAVERITRSLEIKNVRLICGRAEELGHDPGLRESFGLVTSRAVAEIPVLLEYMAPFAKKGGILAMWKSVKIADELASSVKAQELLGTSYFKTYTYDLGLGWGERCILFFRKTRNLPDTYPRRNGAVKAKPL